MFSKGSIEDFQLISFWSDDVAAAPDDELFFACGCLLAELFDDSCSLNSNSFILMLFNLSFGMSKGARRDLDILGLDSTTKWFDDLVSSNELWEVNLDEADKGLSIGDSLVADNGLEEALSVSVKLFEPILKWKKLNINFWWKDKKRW